MTSATSKWLGLAGGLALCACGLPILAAKALARMDANRIRIHVKFLSSDGLEGRGMGQKGSDLAADYIANQLKDAGLRPAGEAGTFFQNVPMVGVKTLPQTMFELRPNVGEAIVLKNLDDFATSNESQTEVADFTAPIVFVGFGIKAPQYNWDDYKDYDLRGKVALLFVNEPPSEDPKFFKGRALTYYGRWIYKFEETARHGAVATLIIHRKDLASYGWEVVRNSLGTDRSYLKLDGTPKLQAASWVQQEVAKKIAAAGGYDLDKLYQQAQSRDFQPIELPVKLKAHVASELHSFDSRNVLAKIDGINPGLREQAIFFTAHYDHLGMNPALHGDKIYNGAVDNATGCGLLLELARVAAANAASGARKAERSFYFAFVTAEEQGLLGSEYLGRHPPMPTGKISLDLNFDALAPIGVPESVEVSGAERTTFFPAVEALAKEAGLHIEPDAKPEAGHYYRSDHFSFARVGVPAFSISEGMKFKGHEVAWGQVQAEDYVKNRYHQPMDEFQKSWNFKGLAKMAQFGYELGFSAANQEFLLEWQAGDEFESPRRRSLVAALGATHTFDAYPKLRLVEFNPVPYPPLARQTRTAGEVRVQATVEPSGEVVAARVLSGHPLLSQATLENIKTLKFAPFGSEPVEIQVAYVFALLDDLNAHRGWSLDTAGQIRVFSAPPFIETQSTMGKGSGRMN
jgi:TonB family protein